MTDKSIETHLDFLVRNGDFLTLLGAWLSEKPVSAAALKQTPFLGKFVDNNGHLLVTTVAMLELALKTEPYASDPLVVEAKRIAEAEKVEKFRVPPMMETLRDKELEAERELVLAKLAVNQTAFRNMWKAYYTNDAWFKDGSSSMPMTADLRTVLGEFVAEGVAPTPEELGLKKQRTYVFFSFDNIRMAEKFMALVAMKQTPIVQLTTYRHMFVVDVTITSAERTAIDAIVSELTKTAQILDGKRTQTVRVHTIPDDAEQAA